MSYQVKFMFADAVTTECEFPAGVGVLEAKGKLLEAWPAEKEPVDGPASMRMIYGGKVLEDSKKFEGERRLPPRRPACQAHTRCCGWGLGPPGIGEK
mmetsp:Transcript_42334/g.103404  ORF Transcript_42334/g.103404 Transcript_42334/m.103404 type:complete len:97 (+) Transcript_42334:254-544(+)